MTPDTEDPLAEEGPRVEKDGSEWLSVPPQSERTERDETDIEIAWWLVKGKDHLLDSTEGHLAVFRAIRYGRRTATTWPAQPASAEDPLAEEGMRVATAEAFARYVEAIAAASTKAAQPTELERELTAALRAIPDFQQPYLNDSIRRQIKAVLAKARERGL